MSNPGYKLPIQGYSDEGLAELASARRPFMLIY